MPVNRARADKEAAPVELREALPAPIDELANRLADDLAASWAAGADRPVEMYLASHPEMTDHPQAVLRLIYEEICIRQERGARPALTEFSARFPQWADRLKVLLECHDLFDPAPQRSQFPEAGATWDEFRLIAELGRGAAGRVFLAVQSALADRQVVVKLTPCRGGEHLSLARLQHTGIVPLFFTRDDPGRNVRTLCMPYFGGITLARLLEDLRPVALTERTGAGLVAALDRAQANLIPFDAFQQLKGEVGSGGSFGEKTTSRGGARAYLINRSYGDAMCWIGGCLAEALQYAHERGLVHMDIKPSNVLLSADGQPMLLDFHLAQPPIAPSEPGRERVGGTLAYMPPEQQAAMSAVSSGQPVPGAVDARADIFSLGVVLYEALGGAIPVLAGISPPLSTINPQVSVGLSDIVSTCLAYDPASRYQTAAALTADLKRHLSYQPLRGVPNRSIQERWVKWRTRNPHAFRLAGAALAVLAAASIALFFGWQSFAQGQKARADALDRAGAALMKGKEWLIQKDYGRALDTFKSGLEEIKDQPDADRLWEQLDGMRALAARFAVAHGLHTLVEEHIRYQYAFLENGSVRAWMKLKDTCADTWNRRRIVELAPGLLPPGIDKRIEPDLSNFEKNVPSDLLDVAIILSDIYVRLAETEEETRQACRTSLRVLQEAERLFGATPALEREKLARAQALGDEALVRQAQARLRTLKPRTAWEFFLLGRSLIRARKLGDADAALSEAMDRDPHAFWPYYYRGECAYKRRDYQRAVEYFSVCTALERKKPAACFLNRALAHKALGHAAEAFQDLDHALKEGYDPARTHYLMALVHRDILKDDKAALAQVRESLKFDPARPDAVALSRQLTR